MIRKEFQTYCASEIGTLGTTILGRGNIGLATFLGGRRSWKLRLEFLGNGTGSSRLLCHRLAVGDVDKSFFLVVTIISYWSHGGK